MTATPILRVGTDTVQAGAHRAWRSRRPARLHVHHGRVWVTASHQLDDHFVDAGMSLLLPANARVLIGAERDASLQIEAPVRPATLSDWWRRLRHALGPVAALRAPWTTMTGCPTPSR